MNKYVDNNGVEHTYKDGLQTTDPVTVTQIKVNPEMSHEVNTSIHKILYRCNAYETAQAFKKLNTGLARFWSSVPSHGRQVRKMRNDLYAVTIDTFADIVISGLNKPVFKDPADEKLFDEIFTDKNNLDFWKLARRFLVNALITGDANSKISVDTELSQYPIVEIYDAENTEYKYKRGFLTDNIFYSYFTEKEQDYELREIYGKGFIAYELYKDGKKVRLTDTEMTSNLPEKWEFSKDDLFNMATLLIIWDSPKYKGRGKPLFDTKIDELDALDEVDSQWLDALRAGRVNRYIPKDLIPKDPEDGSLMRPNFFDNDFIELEGSLNEGSDKIQILQPDIKYDAFLQSYVAALDRCLLGIISPSTLGIDARKLDDNATAQRERERITSWKRAQIIDAFSPVLAALVEKVLKVYAIMNNQTPHDVEVEILFDEYNSPNIEQKLEIVAKGIPGQQIIPWSKAVEIVFDDLTPEEQKAIAEELERLNNPTISEPEMFPVDIDKIDEEETEEIEE